MQNDEMIWQVINHQFCSYKRTIGKAKSDKTTFCQHPYSVTGLCNRTSCPLANSLYATLREENGKVFLCMKTVERAHSPKNLWEKVLLSRNYAKAITQIEEHLQFFPKALMHRNKQRLTKIHQYLLRMRKIKLKELSGRKAKIVQAPTRKIAQRESRREQKALVAAKITNKIEQELVERLANGTYGDIYNFEQTTFNKALGQTENGEEEVETEESEEEDSVTEYVEDLESDEEDSMEEDMEDFEYLGDGQWGKAEDEDSDSSDDDDDDDDEESSDNDDDDEDDDDDDDSQNDDKKDEKPKKKKKKKSTKKGSRVEIEYEEENELEDEQMQEAGMAW
jgi:protein MAK16